MGKIQDIHALEQCINDIVQDYIDDCYNVDDVLAISKKGNKIVVTADARERIVRNSTTEIYPLKNLLRTGDDGEQEPDNDTISDIANSWLFLD
ncbi:MAG: hypothetical protein IKK40_01070 [Bacteroidales bacterium]|nr:hypothetical protein [Bacteroidales bacterium]